MNEAHVTLASRASLTLIGLMVTVPFLQIYHTPPMPAFYVELAAFILGLAALSLLLSGRYWHSLALPPVILAPAGLFLVLLLQLNLGMTPYHETQVLALLYLLWAMLLITLGRVLREDQGFTAISTTLAWYFLSGGEASAIIGLLQHYDVHSFLDAFITARSNSGLSGNIGQSNHYASYICLALASLVFLYASNRLSARTALPLALPLLFVLPLSASRSSWLYLFALLILSLLYRLYSKNSRASATGIRLAVMSCLLLAGCGLTQWLVQTTWFAAPPGTLSLTIADKLFAQAAGTAIRLHLWHEAWLMFLQAPLLGTGLRLHLPRLGKWLMVAVLAASSWTVFAVQQDYQKIEQVMDTSGSAPQDRSLDSQDLAVLQTLHGRTLLSPYVDYALASAIELNDEKLALKLAVSQRVMQFHPSSPALYRHAILLALNHQPEAAIRQAERAAMVYPAELILFADSLQYVQTSKPDTLKPLIAWVTDKLARNTGH